jgi:hypothetical protein
MDDYKRLYEIAIKVGEQHATQAVKHANEIQILRQTIWRALTQLRAGRAGLARQILEEQLKDQQP